MAKGSPDDKMMLVSIKGARVATTNTEGDPGTKGGKVGDVAGKDVGSKLVNDVTA